MAINVSDLTIAEQVTAIYVAYFDRAPDPAGLQYWIEQVEAGQSLTEVANNFARGAEAIEKYPYLAAPDVASSETFITSIYVNLFGRTPDAEGLAYWQAELEGGYPLGKFVLAVLNGAQSPDSEVITNKIAVGLDWAEAAANAGVGVAGNLIAEDVDGELVVYNQDAFDSATSALDGVTADAGSVTDAQAATDEFFAGSGTGETFVLTTGIDDLVGTAGNDLFIGTTGSGGEINDPITIQSGDRINGGEGFDTFRISMGDEDTGEDAVPELISIERLQIQTYDDTFDPDSGASYKNYTDLQVIESYRSSDDDIDLNHAELSQLVEVRWTDSDDDNDISIEYANATVAGDDDTQKLTLQNTGTFDGGDSTAVRFDVDDADGEDDVIENYEVVSKGTTGNALELNDTDETVTLTVSGTADLYLDYNNANNLESINASAMSGDFWLTDITTSQDLTVTSGSGDDRFDIDGANGTSTEAAILSVDAGDGDNDVTLDSGFALQDVSVTTGAGDDTIDVDMSSKATAGSTLVVSSGAGADDIEVTSNSNVEVTIDAGAGDDNVLLDGTGTDGLTLLLGDGDDSFDVGGTVVVNKGDVVDGGAGTDTLLLSLVGAANVTAFSNFEVFDAVGLTGELDIDILTLSNTVTEIITSGATGAGAELLNLGEGVGFRATEDMGASSITLNQKVAGDITITLDADSDDDTSADNNAMTVDVVNATGVDAVFSSDSAFDGTNTQTMNLTVQAAEEISVASGGDNATNVFNLTDANNTVESVTITGAQDLTTNFTGTTELATVDASAMSGGLTIDTTELKAESVANAFDGAELSLGSGDDVVSFGTGAVISGIELGLGEDAAEQDGFDVLISTGAVVATQAADDDSDPDFTIQDGLLTFLGAGPTTLAEAIADLDAALTVDGETVVFEYVGNSYVFKNDDTNGDEIVKLVGATGLNGVDTVDGTNDLYVF